MTAHRKIHLAAVMLCCVTGFLFAVADAGASPVKLKFAGAFGREVNVSQAGKGLEAEDVCLIESKDMCQSGKESTIAGGFEYPFSTAVDKTNGYVYVADMSNYRIEKFGSNGEFLLMWGKGVNKNGSNVCVAGEECQKGGSGSGAGEMEEPQDLAVDSTTGNVYVLDGVIHRIDEFTPEGQFVLMFGGEVNKNPSSRNVCTASESSECQAGKTGTGNGFFQIWPQFQGNMLAVGGPEHLVYVADEGRVQEFERDGTYKTQVTLTSTTPAFPAQGRVTGLAVDGAGDLFVVESHEEYQNSVQETPGGIYEFAPGNATAINQIDGNDSQVEGLALDESGHLAITDGTTKGTLFDLVGGAPPSQFGPPEGLAIGPIGTPATGLSFNARGDLYVAGTSHQDVEMYKPVVGPELAISASNLAAAQASCKQGPLNESLATIGCTLYGSINPEGVSETEVWFQWGTTSALDQKTPPQPVPPATEPQEVSAPIAGLEPNQTIYYSLAASDQNFQPPEPPLLSPMKNFVTPSVPPRIVGQLAASFVKSTSALLTGQVNPENSATEYFAEYGAVGALAHCPNGVRTETCVGVTSTTALKSEKYQTIGATFEATGLQSGTTYSFRLNAINDKGQTAINETGGSNLPEETFTTVSSARPQAVTGIASSVTATGAFVSGQVNPEGESASFAFELGVYNGAATQYGIVASGSAGKGTAPVAEALQLSGLQPSTTYAYRIKIENSFGTSYGLPVTFTTDGLPEVLPHSQAPEMLPVPRIALPEEPKPKHLTRVQKLKKALQACKHKRSRRQRLACERDARKRYGARSKKRGKRK